MRPLTRAIAVALALLAAPLATTPDARQAAGSRMVAIGDVHGAFDAFVGILQAAGLIDANRKWAGGTTVFVHTGDVFDRGAGVREALDLLMRLEDEAKRAGGRVEALLGNHEVMNILGDFRDVSPAALAAFADGRSDDRRKRAYEDLVRASRRRAPDAAPPERDAWMAAHPPGFLEYSDALTPRGKYGKWLRSHDVVVAIDRVGFMHAGISPTTPGTLDEINRAVAADIAAWDDIKAAMVQAQLIPPYATLKETVEASGLELQRIAAAIQAKTPLEEYVTRPFVDRLQKLQTIDRWSLTAGDGPLWFRGYAQWPDSDAPQAAAILTRFALSRFVTGHTPMLPGRIKARFDGTFFLIDTGMLSSHFTGGRASALELQGGGVTAIYTDSREVLVAPSARAGNGVNGGNGAGLHTEERRNGVIWKR